MHRPVCVKCRVEMLPEKNGTICVDYTKQGPYKMWDSDMYRCPVCQIDILVGFGQAEISVCHDGQFEGMLKGFEKAEREGRALVVRSYER